MAVLRQEGALDEAMRGKLQTSLKQLLDLKFALDESSIVAMTDQRGMIRYVNDKFCSISGYSREELLGSDHRIVNSGYHSKDTMRRLWRTISEGYVWRGDLKNKAKDGTYYWVNTTIVPFLDEQGKPYQYLAIRNEVTELKRVEEELQQTMLRMMRIQEEERKRISRELHDGIGQSLFSLLIHMDRILTREQHEGVAALRGELSHVIEEVRTISRELRPSVLDDLGIVPAIRSYLQAFTEHTGIRVQLDSTLRERLDIQVETTIYRIIQEAMTNIHRYAGVGEASVTISENGSRVHVLIDDEGAGFDSGLRWKGVGLFSMEERARSVGGTFHLDSAPGQGTHLHVVIPKSTKK
ncbi:PAS domain-containing sensor histidine kinase [Paenibacillus sp. y28]|uniref:PAS domain-containing sensor histidine kinase n=1 Tax=Paenibacillus sp. y28 TaxID=3129110 RepID=UPI003016B69E